MNNNTRKILQELIISLGDIKEKLEGISEAERDKVDNIPENLQGSEHYSKAEDSAYALEIAIEDLDKAIEGIEEAIQ